MQLRPFFCYFGGKWRASPKYPAPVHDTIVEPFAGAAGYSTRYFDRRVVLVERDPLIANLWNYLIRVTPAEILSIPLDVTGGLDSLDCCQEAKWLVGFWCNKGVTSPRNPTVWMQSGTRPNSYWGETIRNRIARQVEHIRHWEVLEGDYSEAPDIAATWFIDPPYQIAGKTYKYHQIDYVGLADWCKSRPGQVIVCEQVGADWLPFVPFAIIRAGNGRGKRYSAEAIYLTGQCSA